MARCVQADRGPNPLSVSSAKQSRFQYGSFAVTAEPIAAINVPVFGQRLNAAPEYGRSVQLAAVVTLITHARVDWLDEVGSHRTLRSSHEDRQANLVLVTWAIARRVIHRCDIQLARPQRATRENAEISGRMEFGQANAVKKTLHVRTAKSSGAPIIVRPPTAL